MKYLPCTKRIAKRLVCIIESNPKGKPPVVGGLFCHVHSADEKAKAKKRLSDLPRTTQPIR